MWSQGLGNSSQRRARAAAARFKYLSYFDVRMRRNCLIQEYMIAKVRSCVNRHHLAL